MKPPVIAQIVQHLLPGGIETMVIDLQALSSCPDNVHIISLEGTYDSTIKQWPKIQSIPNLHFLNKKPGLRFETVKKLSKLLSSLQIDVIHTHHVGPLLYGGLAAKKAGCRHTHTEHDAWHLNNLRRRFIVGACFALFKPTVVADAQLVSQQIKRYIPFTEPSVILNGIDTDLFSPGDQKEARQQLGLPNHAPILGCAARFTAVKSHYLLISVMKNLPPTTHLALAGGGELEQTLREQVKDLQLEDRVHFVGIMDNMPQFYHAIDIFCLTSKQEGLPLSPLEAQSCGRAVVLTNVGGCREAVDPHSGLIIPYGDLGAMEEQLMAALTYATTDQARHSARRFVQLNSDVHQMIERYEQLYRGEAL